MKKQKRKKTGGRTNSYGEKTVVVSYRVPKSRKRELECVVRLFLDSCKTKSPPYGAGNLRTKPTNQR